MLEADTGLGIPVERYLIGITAHAAAVQGAVGIDRETNPLVSVPRAFGMTAELTKTFLQGLKRLVSGDVSRKQLAGPIGIAEIALNAFIIGPAGWAVVCTRSMSSEYRAGGRSCSLESAVPPRRASESASAGCLKISASARLITRSCSTCASSIHGASARHSVM
jgi:hypothetical protein